MARKKITDEQLQEELNAGMKNVESRYEECRKP